MKAGTFRPMTEKEKANFLGSVSVIVVGVAVVLWLSGCTFHLHVLETTATNDPVLIESLDDITVQLNKNSLRLDALEGDTDADDTH